MQRQQLYNHSLLHFLEPVRPLLDDDQVSEIMILSPSRVYCERKGIVHECDYRFPDQPWLDAFLCNLAEFTGRKLSPQHPTLDARMPDGSRVHAVIPPAIREGISITIRRFGRQRFTIDNLVAQNSLGRRGADFLREAVESHRNIVIAGGTGTGKTTLLNALSSAIPKTERIIVIEDTSELKLDQPHTLYLEAQPAATEDDVPLTIRELFVNSLRMRPDRIVIGEVRRGEALDLIQAMLSGHSGALTTVHACSPLAAAVRLETLCLMGDTSIPLEAVRMQVATALDLVVQLVRQPDGRRRITNIAECQGLDERGKYVWREVGMA